MQLIKLILALATAASAVAEISDTETLAVEPSATAAPSTGGFGAVLQHPFDSLLRIVPHGQWLRPLGDKHHDEHDSVTLKSESAAGSTNTTHVVELLIPPVVDKQGVHIHLDGDVITIIGGYVRHVETGDGKEQNTFVETRRFAKALRLPYGPVKPEEVKAKLEDGGVLRLEITKSDSEEGPHQIEVE